MWSGFLCVIQYFLIIIMMNDFLWCYGQEDHDDDQDNVSESIISIMSYSYSLLFMENQDDDHSCVRRVNGSLLSVSLFLLEF